MFRAVKSGLVRSRFLLAFLLQLIMLGSLPALSTASAAAPDSAVKVLIVRHAEKADPDAEDPELSDAGQKRAALLSRMVSESGVSAIFATQFLRTQQTVEPLAKQLGVKVEQVDSDDVKGLVEKILANHRGDTVLVAAHSNTVPQLIEGLTGQSVDAIDETDYSNLYVVVSSGAGQGTAVRLRYGAAPESSKPAQ